MDSSTSQSVSADEALAFAHVRKVKGFYLHLVQFVVIVGILAIVNGLTSPRYLWVGWVALGWGSGLLVHGLKAFDKVPFLNAGWERRHVESYLGRKLQ